MRPAFQLAHMSVNHLSRSSYGETPPMGGGVRPPGAGPEMGSNRGPFLILALAGRDRRDPNSGPFHAAYPPFLDLQNLQKSMLIICRGPATQIPPPYGRGINNHLSRSSYGETPPPIGRGYSQSGKYRYNREPFFGPVRSGAFLRPIPGLRAEARKTAPQNGPDTPLSTPPRAVISRHFCWVCWVNIPGQRGPPVGP